MRYFKSTFSFLLVAFSALNAQTVPSIQWQKALGGSSGDKANSIQQTYDGGYIMAGGSTSTNGDVTGNHGDTDYWIAKLDALGTIEWQKSLGGTTDDIANSVQQTSDGGYIIAGETYSNDGDVTGYHLNGDCWIVKLDASGNLQWQKTLGGTEYDVANSVKQTSDGGYIVAGETSSSDGDVIGNHGNADAWIVKLDASGNIQWQKSLGGSSYDRANAIQQTSDEGYIIAGTAASDDGDVTVNHGIEDFWIVKLDASGILQWQKSLTGNLADSAESIQQTSDGGYIVAGGSNSINSEFPVTFGISNYCVAKLDANGSTVWQKYFGGSNNDYAYSTQQTSDGGYIVAGAAVSTNGDVTGNHGSSEYWIIKLDASGSEQWQKALGGSSFEEAYAIQQTADGGYILAGSAASADGDITGNHGNGDAWIVKLSSGQLSTAEHNLINKPELYPNPAKEWVNLNNLPQGSFIEIFDLSGKMIFNKKDSTGNIRINTSSFTNGVYIIKVQDKGKIIRSEKLVINK